MTWVILKKMYIDRKTGNVYDPQPTKVKSILLPKEIRNNPEYVEVLEEGEEQSKNYVKKYVPLEEAEVETVEINKPENEREIKVETEMKINYEENKEILEKLNINEASFDELLKLPYVGRNLAAKIVEERAKQQFKDLMDLKSRVALKFGAKWEDLHIRFE